MHLLELVPRKFQKREVKYGEIICIILSYLRVIQCRAILFAVANCTRIGTSAQFVDDGKSNNAYVTMMNARVSHVQYGFFFAFYPVCL